MHKTKRFESATGTDANAGDGCASRRGLLVGGALAIAGLAAPLTAAEVPDGKGIARTAESIHLEPEFSASRARVYAALTDARQFDQVVQLSGVMKSIDSKVPTALSAIEGSPFALFGGYITGRQILLQTNELIVQAWRSASWGPGLFDHGAFPNGEASSLSAGWQANYWTPLRKLLAR